MLHMQPTTPPWLNVLATCSLLIAGLCALGIGLDIALGRRQRMAIMNWVWPITALYAGPLAVWAYLRLGRASDQRQAGCDAGSGGAQRTMLQSIGLAASHCGAGCTLGDLLAESFMIALPFSLFGSELVASWTLDYVFAFAMGIAFQYLTIKPMRDVSVGQALISALQADTLSLTAWQVGMYGWMAIATFGIFGHALDRTGPVFWFMMQIAMLAGFLTASPVNAWLLRRGIKEAM